MLPVSEARSSAAGKETMAAGAVTREIAGNVQQAAAGTRQVSGSVAAVRSAVTQTGSIAAHVLGAAGLPSNDAEHLQSEVTDFLAGVRAA